ncbi:MAG: hypothetical protein IJ593_05895 [Lachnospiraceae bacterium]|nr:hypothetical protein [Lachnospiraceae bacterium]
MIQNNELIKAKFKLLGFEIFEFQYCSDIVILHSKEDYKLFDIELNKSIYTFNVEYLSETEHGFTDYEDFSIRAFDKFVFITIFMSGTGSKVMKLYDTLKHQFIYNSLIDSFSYNHCDKDNRLMKKSIVSVLDNSGCVQNFVYDNNEIKKYDVQYYDYIKRIESRAIKNFIINIRIMDDFDNLRMMAAVINTDTGETKYVTKPLMEIDLDDRINKIYKSNKKSFHISYAADVIIDVIVGYICDKDNVTLDKIVEAINDFADIINESNDMDEVLGKINNGAGNHD